MYGRNEGSLWQHKGATDELGLVRTNIFRHLNVLQSEKKKKGSVTHVAK